MTTSPTFNDATASLFGVLESDCEARSDISTRFVFASADKMRPRINRPVGNSTDGFTTKPSARLVSFISASTLRESATKQPDLPTDLTYPETSFPTSRFLASLISGFATFFFFSPDLLNKDGRIERSTSPLDFMETTRTSTTLPTFISENGFSWNSSDTSVKKTRPVTCAPSLTIIEVPLLNREMIPKTFAPTLTEFWSRKETSTCFLETLTLTIVALIFSPFENLFSSGFLSSLIELAVSIRGTKAVISGRMHTLTPSGNTEMTYAWIDWPTSSVCRVGLFNDAVASKSSLPFFAFLFTFSSSLSSSALLLRVRSSSPPRSPAMPRTATFTVKPSDNSSSGNFDFAKAPVSVMWMRPFLLFGSETSAWSGWSSETTPWNLVPTFGPLFDLLVSTYGTVSKSRLL